MPKDRNMPKAFTLIELIVVIMILAILATIAFMTFSSQSANARDSARLADMSGISKGLSSIHALSGKYPIPDGKIGISASGSSIGYQGYAGENVLGMIKLSEGGMDPLDKTFYTYSINSTQNRYQLLGFLEDGRNIAIKENSVLGSVFAEPTSYSGRYIYTRGDTLGILLQSGSMVPIQTISSIISTGLDISNTTGSYIARFPNSISLAGTGNVLRRIESINSSLSQANLSQTDDMINGSLRGYWNMESFSDGKIKDSSGNGNNGICFDSAAVACLVSGPQQIELNPKTSKAMSFDGIDDHMTLGDGLEWSGALTVLSWHKRNAKDLIDADAIVGNWNWNFDLQLRQGWVHRYYINSDNLMFIVELTDGSTIEEKQVFSPVNVGQKYFSAGVFNPKDRSVRLYVDGVLKHSITASAGFDRIAHDSPYPMMIGNSNVNVGYFNGTIDDVRIYDRALSDSEIQTIYNLSK